MSEKQENFKCGHLLAKEAENIPWYILLVDLIGPYKVRTDSHDNSLIIKSWTMIDPTTRWFEIIQYKGKQAGTIENLLEQTWLCRYRTIIMYYCKN